MKSTKGATGQSGTEFLIMFGVGLAFVMGAFIIGSAYSSENLKFSQAQDAVDRLAQGADYVYTLGPNTKEYVEIYIPNELEQINTSGKRIVFSLSSGNGKVDVFANTKADIIDAVPRNSGKQRILIQYLPSGRVLLGEAGLQCSPALISTSANGSKTVTITNVLPTDTDGVNATIYGSVSQFVSISSPPATAIAGGDSSAATLQVLIPASAASGVYGGELLVSSNNGTCITSISVQVGGELNCNALCRSAGYATGTCRADVAACQAANPAEDETNPSFSASACGSQACCCGPVIDNIGPNVSAMNVTGSGLGNDIGVSATCDDSGIFGNSNILSAKSNIDWATWFAMDATDGAFDSSIEGANFTFPAVSGGGHIICAQCTDTRNNAGSIRCDGFNVTSNDTEGPIITWLDHTDTENLAYTDVNFTGSATDFYGGNNVAACYYGVDIGVCPHNGRPNETWISTITWNMSTPTSPSSYNTSPSQDFKGQLGTLGSGQKHGLCAFCRDSLWNPGLLYNMTLNIPKPDIVIALECTSTMNQYIISSQNNLSVWANESAQTLVKSIDITQFASTGKLTAPVTVSGSGCSGTPVVKVGSTTIASGTISGTPVDLSAYTSFPYTLDLYMSTSGGTNCNISNTVFKFEQTKYATAKDAAKTFIDITDTNTYIGGITFSNKQSPEQIFAHLTQMTPDNKTWIKGQIDNLHTCTANSNKLDDALVWTVGELEQPPTGYGRNDTLKVSIILSAYPTSSTNPYAAATAAKNNNIIVYSFGFEGAYQYDLQSIALITGGKYYYIPDGETLKNLFRNIGS